MRSINREMRTAHFSEVFWHVIPQVSKTLASVAPRRTKALRKRCKNCPRGFRQNRPWQEFCSTACRREFHHNGSAQGALKETLTRYIENEIERRMRGIEALGSFVRREEIFGDEGLGLIRRAVERRRAAKDH
jgi:hypothetical protein